MGEALRGRENALNFARLLLAVGVVVSHAWPLGGFGRDPGFGGQSIGGWCVAGFFAISGYLIPASRQRQSLRAYAVRRGLRILPGLWLCLVVTAFVFAPVAASVSDVDYDLSTAVEYVLANATTLYLRPDVGEELAGVPFPDAWNGSLWTLQWEVLCYLLAGLCVSRSASRRRHVIPALALVGLGGLVGGPFFAVLGYFGAGWLLGAFRDRVRLTWALSAAGVAAIVVVIVSDAPSALTVLPVAYLVLAFGATCPILRGTGTDLSYGLYIFAFPVQQTLALAGVQRAGWVAFLASSLGAALLLARGSWFLVESPALSLAHRWLRDSHGSTRARRSSGRRVGSRTAGAET